MMPLLRRSERFTMAIEQSPARQRREAEARDSLDSVRVLDEPTAIRLAGVSPRTWDRMRARGETPPKTQISERRIGYRLVDFRDWLDARRVGAAPAA
jgi:predicted DNA-binding transcriptional regulator AlpA